MYDSLFKGAADFEVWGAIFLSSFLFQGDPISEIAGRARLISNKLNSNLVDGNNFGMVNMSPPLD